MDLNDSAEVKNNIKIRSIIIAAVIHLSLTIATAGLLLIPLIILWIVGYLICKHEVEAISDGSTRFKKNFPFRFFGEPFGDFQHVFYHRENLENELLEAIDQELKTKTPASNLETVTITDIDKDLSAPENRDFKKADAGRTPRGTTITLLLSLSRFGHMQSIRWWVLAGGYVDRNKKFNFIAYAPITLWFWIIPYLRKDFDVLSRIRTIYSASYNDLDVITQVRSLHEAIFSAMVDELEKNDIDTSDIKAQRMQVMNISISGGRVNMGNVVQGAMNKVAAAVRGAK